MSPPARELATTHTTRTKHTNGLIGFRAFRGFVSFPAAYERPEIPRTCRLEVRQTTRAVAEPVDVRNAREMEHVQQQVVQRRFLRVDEVTVAFQLTVGGTGEHDRQIVVR